MCLCTLTVVVRQVEQDSNDGLHTVLHRLPHGAAVRVELPAISLDHLLTPVQRSARRHGGGTTCTRMRQTCTADVSTERIGEPPKGMNL